ncbi:MAG: hypothetical protein MUC59_12405 [Saprospiraceae bacterium]|jgi:hypothetical protein|nr:hypothetical protein [Saprospiraceae bacterium]
MKSQAIAKKTMKAEPGLSKMEVHPNHHPEFKTAVKNFRGVNKTKVFFAEKYFAGQKSILLDDIVELYEAHPAMSVRAAVVHILQDLPDFLPSENILEVTRLIVEEWARLGQPKTAKMH